MGNRVSISFRNREEESVTLFSHWGGMGFVHAAEDYVNILRSERSGAMYPLDRLEPSTVMVDFIRHLTTGAERVESDLYLGRSPQDGDNSDNGHPTS